MSSHTQRRIRMALVCAVALTATALTSVGITVAHATDAEVLILDGSVSGGTSSLEALAVAAAGLTPVVVSATEWQAKTTAQFASYRALVIGDPDCGGQGVTDAGQNASTWGAAVNGNVLLIGTDPAYHSGGTLTSGPGKLISHGIEFSAAQTGKTGAYVDLSCAYGGQPAGTQSAVLDGLRPGGFSVDGGPGSLCYNDAHIVATHPALAGLTDADLGGWSCSVHEAFTTWPGDFTPLAIARNFGSSFTGSDGTVGTPYILASGTGLHSFPLSLDPLSQSLATGSSATVTAQLLDGATGLPVTGQALRFRISAGPDAGLINICAPATCVTDSAGHVAIHYTGSAPGSDTVQAWVDTNADGVPSVGEPQTTAGVIWTGAPAQAYVAMGDSYSSGEGSFDYYPDSNNALTFNSCHRSPHAYGPLLDAARHLGTYTFSACSGAVTNDVLFSNHDNPNEPAQISLGLGDATRVVTLTLGGNDANFPHVITKCVNGVRPPGTGAEDQGGFGCSRNKGLRSDINARLSALDGQPTDALLVGPPVHALSDIYRQIAAKAPNAKIYVGGYPRLFGVGERNYQKFSGAPSGSSCFVGFTSKFGLPLFYYVDYLDAIWLDVQANRLNGVVQHQVAVAKAAGVNITYVSAGLFATHGLCDTREPWINQIDFTTDPSVAPSSFHPKPIGQYIGYEKAFAIFVR